MKRYATKKFFKLTTTILGISILLIPGPFPKIWMIGFALSFLCFITIGGFKRVIVPPFEDSKRYKECVRGQMYNVEEQLQKEKENRDRAYLEQSESWKTALEGLGIFLAGLILTIICYITAFFCMPLILGVFPGYFIMFMSFRWLWEGFINSSLPIAGKISEQFMIHSTSVKIEEATKLINALSKRLEEEREKEEATYGEVLE